LFVLKQNTIEGYTRGDASRINKHKKLHRTDIKEHTQARTTFNGNPQIVHQNMLKSGEDECFHKSMGAKT